MFKTVVIYPGRFQPFGPHHFKSYKWLCSVFGPDNVFIVTSNHQDLNSPLTFQEKLLCISKYNISKDKIVEVKNPYKADEVIQRFDPDNTSVIFAYGEKDFGRIKFQKTDGTQGYFRQFYGQKQLEPLSKCGYVVDMPDASLKYDGQEINGTFLRQILPLANRDEFSRIMNYYDPQIHFLFKKKFHPDIVQFTETILSEGSTITKTQLQRIEQYADQLFKSYGIDINFQDLSKETHFWQRVNDPRNGNPITTDELRQLFKKASSRFGNKLSQSPAGFEAVLKDMETDINLPFILKYDRQNNELDLIPKTIMRKPDFKSSSPSLAMESVGKKYNRHIQHIYEDETLTSNDYLDIAEMLMKGSVNASLKLDGYNFKVTFKGGRIFCARSKSELINPLTILQLKEKYKTKPDQLFVFVKAMEDIGNSLLKLGTNRLNDIFQNGRTFLNFEILHPRAKNVFDFGEPTLSLHSLVTFNENGEEVNQIVDLPFELINGRTFKIQKTPAFKLEPLNDPSTERFVLDKIKSGKDLKETILLLENLIIQNFCKNNPQNQDNILNLTQIINAVKGSVKTEEEKQKFNESMKLLNFIGGIEVINPIEGLVFEYKNKTYKCTGAFGCLQPILNIYNRQRFSKK